MTAAEEDSHYQFFFGNISMTAEEEKTATVSNVSVDDAEFDEDGMYAGFRLSWESDEKASYYEVYRIKLMRTNPVPFWVFPIQNVSILTPFQEQMKPISPPLR